MSRHWSEHKYISADTLWSLMDELSSKIDSLAEDEISKASESYKLLLMGRREAISALCDVLHEEEQKLGDIAKFWGITDNEKLDEEIGSYYGYDSLFMTPTKTPTDDDDMVDVGFGMIPKDYKP